MYSARCCAIIPPIRRFFSTEISGARMITKHTFLNGLVGTTNIQAEHEFIYRCAKEGDISTLTYLRERLLGNDLPSGIPDWARRGVTRDIVESVALTPGLLQANAAVMLITSEPIPSDDAPPYLPYAAVASRLAASQSPETLSTVLTDLQTRNDRLEIAAMLLFEGILRDKVSANQKPAQVLYDNLHIAGHPLAWLPLERHRVEAGTSLPIYGFHGMTFGMPFGPSDKPATTPIPADVPTVTLQETTTENERRLISSAVDGWARSSNGQIEAGTFMADDLLPPDNSYLLKLSLKSIAAESTDKLTAHLQAADAFAILFSAASSGGAYGGGCYGAYGRLLAWRSVAGLIGADERDSFADVSTLAEKCDWSSYEAANDWFYQVAWDIGLVCVRPGRKQVAILAATDTD